MSAPIAVALAAVLEVINDEDDMLLVENRISEVRNDELEMMMLMNNNWTTSRYSTSKRAKMESFLEDTVPLYSPDSFYFYFRMTKSTVEKIVHNFRNLQSKTVKKGAPPMDTKDAVLMGLWTLGNPEPFRQISGRFNVSISTAYDVFGDFCDTLIRLVPRYVSWPNKAEMERIADSFEGTVGLPGIIGVLDSCHITVRKPKRHLQPNAFINQSKAYSIKLMAVVDHNMLFRDIYVGCPGSFSDAQVFQNNPLSTTLAGNALPSDYHIVGDSALPLSKSLLVPFKDDGQLAEKQKSFNEKLVSIKEVVANAFGLLKGKFRRIKTVLDVTDTERASLITTAACVVHNICIKEQDWHHDDIFITADDQDDDQYTGNAPGQQAGQAKRDEITEELWD